MSDKIEFIEYNAVLAITGAIRGTSREKLYQELGLESLKDRRWLRWLCPFHETLSTKLPPYLYDSTTPLQSSDRNPDHNVIAVGLLTTCAESFVVSK